MSDSGFRRLLKQDRQPVATAEPMRLKHVGEPVGLCLEVVEGKLCRYARIRDVDQREPARAVSMLVAGIDAHVVARRNPPGEIPIEPMIIRLARQHRGPPARARSCRARAKSTGHAAFATALRDTTLIRCARYSALAWMSLFSPSAGVTIPFIASAEKLDDSAFS